MFAFSQVQPRTNGILAHPGIDIGTYLSNVADQGSNDSVFGVVQRMTEDQIYKEGPILQPDELNRKYGIQGQLTFNESEYAKIAELRNLRKKSEMEREYNLSEGNTGFFSGRGLAGLGVGFLSSLANPLDLGLSFMPITGSLARAKQLEAAGAGAFRQALARGLITEEALASRLPAPRFFSAMIEGAAQQTIFEIPLAYQNYKDQANYTAGDFMTNIATGGVLAGGLHLLTRALESAARHLKSASPETREVMLRQAMEQFLKDRDVKVSQFVTMDEAHIGDMVDAELRNRAMAAIDPKKLEEAVGAKFDEKITSAAIKYSDGEVKTGPIHAMIDGPLDEGAREGFVTDKGRFIDRSEAAALVGLDHPAGTENIPGMAIHDEHYAAMQQQLYAEHVLAGKSDVEAAALAAKDIADIRSANDNRAKQTLLNRPEVQAAIQAEREAQIKKFVDDNRPKALEQAKQAEIARQIQDGKILRPEDAKKWQFTEPEVAKAALAKHAADLEKEVKSLIEELGDDAIAALEKLKIDTGAKPGDMRMGLHDIPIAVWNGAIEAVQMAIRAGKKVSKAIDLGVQHLEKYYQKHVDPIAVDRKLYEKGQKQADERLAEIDQKYSPEHIKEYAREILADSDVGDEFARYMWKENGAVGIVDDVIWPFDWQSLGIDDEALLIRSSAKKQPGPDWAQDTGPTGKVTWTKRKPWAEIDPTIRMEIANAVNDAAKHIADQMTEHEFGFGSDDFALDSLFDHLKTHIPELQDLTDAFYSHQNSTRILKMHPDREALFSTREPGLHVPSPLVERELRNDLKDVLNTDDYEALVHSNFGLDEWKDVRRKVYEADPQLGATIEKEIFPAFDAPERHTEAQQVFRDQIKGEIAKLEEQRKLELQQMDEQVKAAESEALTPEHIAQALGCLTKKS